MDDVGRKKQVQVRRTSWRHKVTSVDANTGDEEKMAVLSFSPVKKR